MDLFLLAPIHSVGFLHGPGVKSYKKWALTPYCRDEFQGGLIESLGLPVNSYQVELCKLCFEMAVFFGFKFGYSMLHLGYGNRTILGSGPYLRIHTYGHPHLIGQPQHTATAEKQSRQQSSRKSSKVHSIHCVVFGFITVFPQLASCFIINALERPVSQRC